MVRIGRPGPASPGTPQRGGAERSRRRKSLWSLLRVRSVVGQMLALQLTIVLLLAVGAAVLLVLAIEREATRSAADRSLAAAESFAHAPGVVDAMKSPDPPATLRPVARQIRLASGVDFVIVVNRHGIAYTHPQPNGVGKPLAEDYGRLLAGHRVQGPYGPAGVFRTAVPIKDRNGSVIGAVSVGVVMKSLSTQVTRQLPAVLGGTAAAAAVITAGAVFFSRRLLRQTRGLGPAEITRLYEHHDAVLHAAREGVVIVDADRRLLLANDEAQRLLDLPPDAQGRAVGELGLPQPTAELLASGRAAADEIHLAGGRALAVNQRPLDRYGGPSGSVATLRDSTELQMLSGRVEAARERLNVLYDATLRIGSTLDVTRTAEDLAKVAVPRFADGITVDLADPVLRGDEPVGADQQLSRIAATGICDDFPFEPVGARITFSPGEPQAAGLTDRRAHLEPDLRAPGPRAGSRSTRKVVDHGVHSLIAAPLCVGGAVLGVTSFWRSQKPEPFEEDDLVLVEELVARTAVHIDNARRYTREHTMAVTLQRSLLPRSLPEQNALDVAFRYLPAQAAVGGDWFDVIPLPGARVALVVGDVVGQGLHAAATMGRLRTAVRNFSALELQPDELLARLDLLADTDDQVDGTKEMKGVKEAKGADADTETETETGFVSATVGATCLYVIYDPVERRCSMAGAGHLPPVLVRPGGEVEFLELPTGPPLGVGGFPFTSTEVEVPEGSTLVLYTNGLVEHPGRDIDDSLDDLRRALSQTQGEPDEACDAVLKALLPARPRDDIALLMGRTHALPEDRVARWDVPRDPAAVGRIRAAVTDQLTAWDLEEAGFVTELILSELVTNAIRYAGGPIGVRLLLDRKLVCEVSDGSSTSPHLRYAETTDEGGRGLFLVAQLAERWGTRYTPHGKVIWSEQPLPA